ncbi:MAG TPA: glycogen synthase [Euzebyales bacterium]|nr:glycogen synthase [Euzebyales bacterium]
MTTVRVGLLTREYPPEVYGGAGVHVEYLARALAEFVAVDVHCFGAPRTDRLVAATYRPWAALAGDDGQLAALRHLSTDLAMVAGVAGVDIVHSHTWYTNLAGHLSKLAYGIPHVLTTHSLEPLRPWKREQLAGGYDLSSFAERTAVLGADAVIAVSRQMRDDVLTSYPQVDPERVTVIPNGIDTDVYSPDPATDVLARLGVDLDRPIVTFVGRITRQKGFTHLLDAARFLAPEAQLVLCAGAADTPDLQREVSAKVDHLGEGRDGVWWIERHLPRPDVVQILSHTTVFACPSIYEPFGLVNVEAMACEAAVVGSHIGGIPEIIVEGETGHLVRFEPGDDPYGTPADPDRYALDLANAINDLIADPDRAAEWGRQGRRRVLAEFSWTGIAERTAQLYRTLVG